MPDDDYELPEEDEDVELTEPKAAARAFAEARKTANAFKKERDALAAQVKDLLPIKEQFETAQLRSVFTSLELPEKYADLYRKVNPQGEVTPEAVKAFAEEYSLPGGSPAPAPAPAPVAPAGGFAPPVPTVPTSPIITRKQLEQVYKLQGPDKAAQYIKEGRVQWHNLPS